MSIFNDLKDCSNLVVAPFNGSIFGFYEKGSTIIGRKIANGNIPMTFGLNPIELKGIRENSDAKQEGATLVIGKKTIPLLQTNKILNLKMKGKFYMVSVNLTNVEFVFSDDFNLTQDVWVYAEDNKITFFSTDTEKFTLAEFDCMTSVTASCHIAYHKYLNLIEGSSFVCFGERFVIYNDYHYYSCESEELPLSLEMVRRQIEKFVLANGNEVSSN